MFSARARKTALGAGAFPFLADSNILTREHEFRQTRKRGESKCARSRIRPTAKTRFCRPGALTGRPMLFPRLRRLEPVVCGKSPAFLSRTPELKPRKPPKTRKESRKGGFRIGLFLGAGSASPYWLLSVCSVSSVVLYFGVRVYPERRSRMGSAPALGAVFRALQKTPAVGNCADAWNPSRAENAGREGVR